MKVYLDVSCLNRPFDDQTDPRVRLESEAIILIFEQFDSGNWRHISSEMVEIEVEAIPNEERFRRVLALLPDEIYRAALTDSVFVRANYLERLGFKAADSVHIACAESAAADTLLTCDDRMLKRARRLRRQLEVRVENPVNWIQEQIDASAT